MLGKSPYKDQNLVLIFGISPYFEEIDERMANLFKLPVLIKKKAEQ